MSLHLWLCTGFLAKAGTPVAVDDAQRGQKRKLHATEADWQAYYRRNQQSQAIAESGDEVSSIPESEYDQLAQQAEQARLALERAKARQEAEERAWYALQAAVIRNAEEEARQAQIRLQAARDALLAQQAFDDYMQQQADMVFALRQQDDELALLLILLEA